MTQTMDRPTREEWYQAQSGGQAPQQPQRDRWQDFMVGLVGGAVGVLAMDLFRQHVSPLLMPDDNGQGANGNTRQGQGGNERQQASLSLVGQHHRSDESATAALGRIMYHAAEDRNPDKATKSELSNLVHWSYGILQGGLYGAVRPAAAGGDLLGGALFGTGLWLLGDELAVPLLGLQDGPSAAPPSTHLNRLALHLTYGMATAATTQLLKQIT